MIDVADPSLPAPAPTPAGADRIFAWVLAGFAVICASVIAMVFVATYNLARSDAATDAVNHTQALILDTNELVAQCYAADAKVRTFLSSGSARDRSACHALLNDCIDRIASVQSLARQDEAQAARIGKIAALMRARIDIMHDLLGSDTPEGRAQAARLLDPTGGTDVLREIKLEADALKQGALEVLRRREHENYRRTQATRWTVWSCLLLDFLLLGGMAVLLRNDFATRRARAKALQEENARLDDAVNRRTAALRVANEQLQNDVIEQTWDRLALEHQLNYNQLIINSIREAVIVVTKALHVSRVNPALLHLTGRPLDDVINRPLQEFVRLAADRAGHPANELLLRAMQDEQDLRYQTAVLTNRAGQEFSVIVNLFPLRDSGKVVGAVIIIDDPLLYHAHPTNELPYNPEAHPAK